MERWARVGSLLAAGLTALVGCGDHQPPDAVAHSSEPIRERVRSSSTSAAPEDTDVARLAAAWLATLGAETNRRDATEHAADALVAAGPRAIPALIALLGDGERSPDVARLLARFRGEATGPLCAAVDDDDTVVAAGAMAALGELGPLWARSAHGEEICRRLIRRVDAYVPGGWEADEWTSKDVLAYAAGELLDARSRPAVQVVVADLVRAWLRWAAANDDDAVERANEWLDELGSDATPAAALLVAALPDLDETARPTALSLLREIGSAAPETLPALRKLLASEDPSLREGTARILRAWGDAAAAAVPDLRLLLDAREREVRSAAAYALCAIPSGVEHGWRTLLLEAADPDNEWVDGSVLARLVQDDAHAGRIVGALPAMGEELGYAVELLSECRPDLAGTLAARLAAGPTPEHRAMALSVWDGKPDPPPAMVDALFADPDESVRIEAAGWLAGDPEYAERVEATAKALVTSGAADVRAEAVWTLGFSQPAAWARALVVAALGDPDEWVRRSAAEVLCWTEEPIVGEPDGVPVWLAARVLDKRDGEEFTSVLVRCEGGVALFERAIRTALGRGYDPSETGREIIRAVLVAGPRAKGLIEDLIVASDASGARYREEFLEAVAIIGRNPHALALQARDIDAATEALLDMGAPGRSALVMLAGRVDPVDVRESLWMHDDDELRQGIVAAARCPADHTYSVMFRIGAAGLAPLLSDRQAVPLLAVLASDEDPTVRLAALRSLTHLERQSPGTIDPEPAGRALMDEQTREEAHEFSRVLGRRAKGLTSILQGLVQNGDDRERVVAATTLWNVTGEVAPAAGVMRAVLAKHDQLSVSEFDWSFPWDDMVAVFGAADPDPGDVALFLRVLPTDGLPLVPLLARHGAAAAPAVPALRWMLTASHTTFLCGNGLTEDLVYPAGDAAASVLGAIGPGARDALGDLRRYIAETGDPSGAARDAIRRIEASRE